MIAPFPNCRSMEARASSRAWRRSLFTSAMGDSPRNDHTLTLEPGNAQSLDSTRNYDNFRGPIPLKSTNGALRRPLLIGIPPRSMSKLGYARNSWGDGPRDGPGRGV